MYIRGATDKGDQLVSDANDPIEENTEHAEVDERDDTRAALAGALALVMEIVDDIAEEARGRRFRRRHFMRIDHPNLRAMSLWAADILVPKEDFYSTSPHGGWDEESEEADELDLNGEVSTDE